MPGQKVSLSLTRGFIVTLLIIIATIILSTAATPPVDPISFFHHHTLTPEPNSHDSPLPTTTTHYTPARLRETRRYSLSYDFYNLNDDTFQLSTPIDISPPTQPVRSTETFSLWGRVSCNTTHPCLAITSLSISPDFNAYTYPPEQDDLPPVQECAFSVDALALNIFAIFTDAGASSRVPVDFSPSSFGEDYFIANNTLPSTPLTMITPWDPTSLPSSLLTQLDFAIKPSCLTTRSPFGPYGKYPIVAIITILSGSEPDPDDSSKFIQVYRNITIPIDLYTARTFPRVPAVTNEFLHRNISATNPPPPQTVHDEEFEMVELFSYAMDTADLSQKNDYTYPFENGPFPTTSYSKLWYPSVTLQDVKWQWEYITPIDHVNALNSPANNLLTLRATDTPLAHCSLNGISLNMTISPDLQTIVATTPLPADGYADYLLAGQRVTFHCGGVFVRRATTAAPLVDLFNNVNYTFSNPTLNLTMLPITAVFALELHSHDITHVLDQSGNFETVITVNRATYRYSRRLNFVYGDRPLQITPTILAQAFRVPYSANYKKFDNSSDYNNGHSYHYDFIYSLPAANFSAGMSKFHPNISRFTRIAALTMRHDAFWFPDYEDDQFELQDTLNNVLRLSPVYYPPPSDPAPAWDNTAEFYSPQNNIVINITDPSLSTHTSLPWYLYYNEYPIINITDTPARFAETYSPRFQLSFHHYIFARSTGKSINQPMPTSLSIDFPSIDLFNLTRQRMQSGENMGLYGETFSVKALPSGLSSELWSSFLPYIDSHNFTSYIANYTTYNEHNEYSSIKPGTVIPWTDPTDTGGVGGLFLSINPHYPYFNKLSTDPLILKPIHQVHVKSLHHSSLFSLPTTIYYDKNHTTYPNDVFCFIKNNEYDEYVQNKTLNPPLNDTKDPVIIQIATSFAKAKVGNFLQFSFIPKTTGYNDDDYKDIITTTELFFSINKPMYSSFYIICPAMKIAFNTPHTNFNMDYVLIGHQVEYGNMFYTTQLVGGVMNYDNSNAQGDDLRWAKYGLSFPSQAYAFPTPPSNSLSMVTIIIIILVVAVIIVGIIVFFCIYFRRCNAAFCCVFFRVKHPKYYPTRLLADDNSDNADLLNQGEGGINPADVIDYPPLPPQYQPPQQPQPSQQQPSHQQLQHNNQSPQPSNQQLQHNIQSTSTNSVPENQYNPTTIMTEQVVLSNNESIPSDIEMV